MGSRFFRKLFSLSERKTQHKSGVVPHLVPPPRLRRSESEDSVIGGRRVTTDKQRVRFSEAFHSADSKNRLSLQLKDQVSPTDTVDTSVTLAEPCFAPPLPSKGPPFPPRPRHIYGLHHRESEEELKYFYDQDNRNSFSNFNNWAENADKNDDEYRILLVKNKPQDPFRMPESKSFSVPRVPVPVSTEPSTSNNKNNPPQRLPFSPSTPAFCGPYNTPSLNFCDSIDGNTPERRTVFHALTPTSADNMAIKKNAVPTPSDTPASLFPIPIPSPTLTPSPTPIESTAPLVFAPNPSYSLSTGRTLSPNTPEYQTTGQATPVTPATPCRKSYPISKARDRRIDDYKSQSRVVSGASDETLVDNDSERLGKIKLVLFTGSVLSRDARDFIKEFNGVVNRTVGKTAVEIDFGSVYGCFKKFLKNCPLPRASKLLGWTALEKWFIAEYSLFANDYMQKCYLMGQIIKQSIVNGDVYTYLSSLHVLTYKTVEFTSEDRHNIYLSILLHLPKEYHHLVKEEAAISTTIENLNRALKKANVVRVMSRIPTAHKREEEDFVFTNGYESDSSRSPSIRRDYRKRSQTSVQKHSTDTSTCLKSLRSMTLEDGRDVHISIYQR